MTNPTSLALRYRRDIRTPLLAAAAGVAGLLALALAVVGFVVLA